MTENYMPWLVLAGIVLVSLVVKGYITIPWKPPALIPPSRPAVADPAANLSAQDLGALMVVAAKREADADVAQQFAREAADKLKAQFTAPFSPAESPPKPGG